MKNYLKETELLDYKNSAIQKLINSRGWRQQDTVDKVKNIYNFVRDEIVFGYNTSDDVPASRILSDGLGQCNTKATLLMALLRAVGVPNRIHGFTINKALQKGAITGVWYKMAPNSILHSWVEVLVNEKWYFLEGVILDKLYLGKLQEKFKEGPANFCGFGAYTQNFQQPQIDWNLNHTFIQEQGINHDFGLFDTPDEFYAQHQQKINFIKRFLFKNIARHKMNKNVAKIRET